MLVAILTLTMIALHRTISKDELKSHLVNLFRVAAADGKISRDEFELLFQQSRKLGVSDHELAVITAEAADHQVIVPPSLEERVQHLFDLITMVVADHKIDLREIEICGKIANSYGINPDVTDKLIAILVEASNQDIEGNQQVLGQIDALLNG